MKYGITSKTGMSVFGWARTKKEAAKLARQAREIGLDGEIFEME